MFARPAARWEIVWSKIACNATIPPWSAAIHRRFPLPRSGLLFVGGKPFARWACSLAAGDLIKANLEKSPDARRVEAIVRMRLQEFVDLENGIAHDLRNLDVARSELSLAFQWLAQEIAEEQQGADQTTLASATIGLRRATCWYDHKRGYPFAEYARWWILEAIEKHRE